MRDQLDDALDAGDEHDGAFIEGYGRMPQSDAADAWGDLAIWSATNARRNAAALDDEDGAC